jgi:large subunit ribosomal protein L9
MRLILTEAVPGLGEQGDIVTVAPGYGRNYLLPKKKALPATDGTIQHAEKVVEARIAAEKKAKTAAESIAKSLVGTRVVIAAQTGDDGRLFGSVGVSDVVEGVHKFTGVQLDRNAVQMDNPIKSIGLHDVKVKVHSAVEFALTIDVIPA